MCSLCSLNTDTMQSLKTSPQATRQHFMRRGKAIAQSQHEVAKMAMTGLLNSLQGAT